VAVLAITYVQRELTINVKFAMDRFCFAIIAVLVIRRSIETIALFVLIRFSAIKGTA